MRVGWTESIENYHKNRKNREFPILIYVFISRYATKNNHSQSSLSYYHCIGNDPLVYRTIGQQFARAADKFGDNEAIVSYYEGKRLTYAEAQKKVYKSENYVFFL